MNNLKSILARIEETLHAFPQWHNLGAFVADFHQMWRKLGNQVQQELVQAQINQTETQYSSPRTKREKRYYTPLGEMVLVRRAYVTPDGLQVKVDSELGLPKDKWLPMVLELACALGVSSEFPNSHQLFQKWTDIDLTEKTLANQVEHTGNQLQSQQQQQLDLASRLEKVQAIIEEISREIETVQANSPVAPLACNLLRFRAKGKGGAYWYYKWQSPKPIFVTKSGKPSRYKYIGKAGSPAFLEAVEMMRNRTQISALQQVLHTLALGREDLLEEASRRS